jgi:hypothetical protein
VSRGGGGGELKPQCVFKTRDGRPCGGRAIGSYSGCWNHDPDFELFRCRNARKGGQRGGRGRGNTGAADLLRLQNRFEKLAEEVLAGTVDRADAAVAAQCLNGARSRIAASAKLREIEDFEKRLDALEKRRGMGA